jgi:hypothetical protein
MIKPFPTKAGALKNELLRILDGYEDPGMIDMMSRDCIEPVDGVPTLRKEEAMEHEVPVAVVLSGIVKEDGKPKPMAIEHIQADTVEPVLGQDVSANGEQNPGASESPME